MPLEQRKDIFGIHQITAYNIDTRVPYGTAKVLGAVSMNFNGEHVSLQGGSNAFPWAVENGVINAETSITLREYPNWLFDVFYGQTMTENTAEASAAVSTALANVSGASVQDASTGIATATVKAGNEADVKTGIFVVKAVSATTVDVYAMSDAGWGDVQFVDESLKINATPLTITTSTAVEIPGFGVELTGGSGAIAMTEGDTAVFDTRAINSGSEEVVVGKNGVVYKEFGLVITPQQKRDGEIITLDMFRCKAIGFPFNFSEKQFSESETTIQAYRDEGRNGVFSFNRSRDTL